MFGDYGPDVPDYTQAAGDWAARMRQQASGARPPNPYPTASAPTPEPAPPSAPAPATAPPPNAPPPAPAPSAFNYENARDSWMSGKYGQGEAGARAWAAANGVQYNGGDTISLPNGGGQIDIIGNLRGGGPMANNWTPAGGNGPNPGGQGNAGAPGGGGGVAGAAGTASNQDRYNQLYGMLMKQATQGLNVDANNPVIKQQTDAYNAAQTRERSRYLADLAERQGANANLGAEQRMTAEDVGQKTGQLQASLMGQELQAKRGEIQYALGQMGDLLTNEQKLDLQKELTLYDNAIKQQQLAQQESQFNNQLGFNYADRDAYWRYMNSPLNG